MSIQKGVALVGKIKVTLTREELPFNLDYMTSNGLAAEKPVDNTASLDKKLGRVINKQTIHFCTSNRLMSRSGREINFFF